MRTRGLTQAQGLAALLMVQGACHAGGLVLIRDGQPRAEIVVGEGASSQAQSAAAELQAYLKRISGAELPVVATATGGQPLTIRVGEAAAGPAAKALGLEIPKGLTFDFDDEGYVVATFRDALLLAGNETDPYEGTWYAVYDLLQSLGCRWYFPGTFGEVVPKLATIEVPAGQRVCRPELRVRDTWYSGHLAVQAAQSAEFDAWKRRNRMSQRRLWAHCGDPEAKFLQNPVDDSTYRLLPKEKFWAEHPEFYAMMPGGGRNERFLCMSSPGALQAATDTVVAQFQARPDHHTFAFSPPDAPVLCHCPECTAAMHGGYGGEGNGDVSDAYFGFVFRLADAVAKAAPEHWITTMAYYNRCRPPEGVSGRRTNLLIQLASIQQCTNHSYADPQCPSRHEYAAMLRRWQELSAGQVFYEYDPHDWSHSQRPVWRSQAIADDLRLLKAGGGWGYSNEGQMAWMATGLNYYVRSRLAWDLRQDPADIIGDFCARFFGPAAEPMRRYYTGVEAALRDCPAHLFAFSEDARDAVPILFPPAFRERSASLLAVATRLAADEPYAGRVRAFRLHFDRMAALAGAHDAAVSGDYPGAAKCAEKATQTVGEMGDTMLLQDAGPWGGVCSGAGVAEAMRKVLPWTDGSQGKLVTVLPAQALFRTDPASQGVVQRWSQPGGTEGWRPIGLTSAWHLQGVVTPEGRPYRGVAWYRVSLDWKGDERRSVGMYVPDLRGSALWLWCNGTLVGYLAKGSDERVIDLTGRLSTGRNEVVFRADGAGGLALPPFLFQGATERLTELSVFPSQWLFRTDPQDQGRQGGWFRTDADESAWQAIPVPIAWEQTAVGAYDGVAWYRVRFAIPAEVTGKRLVLRFGAVDEEAWVYLNGEFVGEHSTASTGQTVHQIWDKPFDVKLPNARPGAGNLLAVRVCDSLMAGGIFKPVRLCVGEPEATK